MADPVLFEVIDGVATITLNRPDRLNAYTAELGTQYFDALDRAEADPDVRVVVVTGAGRGFCAGADMDLLAGIGSGERRGGADAVETRNATHPTTIGKLVIAAINGPCAGIGLSMAMACDIRFAAASAKFTTAFARRGLIAEHGLSWLLPNNVGPAVAMDLLASGRVFRGTEAYEMGLVNKVCPDDDLRNEVAAYAADVAANVSPTSVAIMKQQVYRHPGLPLADAVAESNDLMVASLRRDDFREGVSSFVEKRPPNFAPFTGQMPD